MMDHRWGKRVAVQLPVRLRCLPDAIGSGVVTDLSLSGAWVNSELAPAVYSHVEVTIDSIGILDDSSSPSCTRLFGYVVRVQPHGFGIEWNEPDVELLTALMTREDRSVQDTVGQPPSRVGVR
jgi:hypothetical protein